MTLLSMPYVLSSSFTIQLDYNTKYRIIFRFTYYTRIGQVLIIYCLLNNIFKIWHIFAAGRGQMSAMKASKIEHMNTA